LRLHAPAAIAIAIAIAVDIDIALRLDVVLPNLTSGLTVIVDAHATESAVHKTNHAGNCDQD
jgi:hypothetical protein